MPIVVPSARPGSRKACSRGEPASRTSDTAPIADDAYGAGHTARPSSSSTTAASTMPPPAPPNSSGTSIPTTPSSASPSHTVVGADARALVLGAHVRVDRRAIGEEAAHRLAQHLLVGRELEVHRRRKLASGAMRLQYAPEEEQFRAELVEWLTANAPGNEALREREAVERAHARVGARVAARSCSTPAGWFRGGRPSSAAATRRRPSR